MYIYPQWTFKKNFDVDLFTGHITKTSDNDLWDARAYITDAFDYSSGVGDLVGTGIKVFHNVNEGEVTDYAFGITSEDYPNNITTPAQIGFGFHFYDSSVDVIHNGVPVHHIAVALNTAYFLEIEADQTLKAFYEDENRNQVEIVDCGTVLDPNIYHAVLVAKTAIYTDLQIQIDTTGVKAKHILDMQYTLDGALFESIYSRPYDIPISANKIRVSTSSNIRELSLNKDSVKVYRYLPSDENPDINKVLVLYDVPDQWGTNNYFDIFVHELLSGYVYQVVVGTDDNRLVTYTKWRHIIDNLDTPIYQNMSNDDFVLMLYSDLLERAIDPSVAERAGWVDNLNSNVYTREYVVMRFVNSVEYNSKVAPKSPPEYEIPFEIKTAVFKTAGEIPKVDEIKLNQFFNDIYYKAKNLDALIDIDKIVHEVADIFDYAYPVTEYNAETNTYFHVEDPKKVDLALDNTDMVLEFENSKVIEQLFVSQYLPEYAKYMTDLNDESIILINAAEAENLKEILFKNITLMNYFKGNKTQMQFLISIFSSSIGYYYVSVDPDPYDNFVYRISTSLPEKYWIDDIKDITHPLGWNDFYIYVPKDALNWHQMKIMSAEEFESFWELHSQIPPTSFIDVADYIDEFGNAFRFGNYVGNAMLNDLTSPKEFPFYPSGYNAKIDYNNSSKGNASEGLFYELRSEIREVTVDVNIPEDRVISGVKPLFSKKLVGDTWEIEFLRSGIASIYNWKIYRGASYIGSLKTYIPKLKYKVKAGEVVNIVLDLTFGDMSFPIYNYNLDNRHSKIINSSGIVAPITFLDQITSVKSETYNSVLVGDTTSEKEFMFNEGEYEATLDFTRITSIIPSINIINTGTKYEVFYNDISTQENLIHGLFNEFEWSIFNGALLLHKFNTKCSVIDISLPSGNLVVNLIRDDISYLGPNITI